MRQAAAQRLQQQQLLVARALQLQELAAVEGLLQAVEVESLGPQEAVSEQRVTTHLTLAGGMWPRAQRGRCTQTHTLLEEPVFDLDVDGVALSCCSALMCSYRPIKLYSVAAESAGSGRPVDAVNPMLSRLSAALLCVQRLVGRGCSAFRRWWSAHTTTWAAYVWCGASSGPLLQHSLWVPAATHTGMTPCCYVGFTLGSVAD